MRSATRLVPGAFIAVLMTVVLTGCSTQVQPTAPAGASSSIRSGVSTDAAIAVPNSRGSDGLVDLRLGRVTRLDVTFRGRLVAADGSILDEVDVHSIVERRVTGTEVRNGRTYVVESVTYQQDGEAPEPVNNPPSRQDRSGYYFYQPAQSRGAGRTIDVGDAEQPGLPPDLSRAWTKSAHWSAASRAELAKQLRIIALVRAFASPSSADGIIASSPGAASAIARAPGGGGPLEDESTYLRYPLHPGATWDGVVGFNVWTVEAVGNTELPIGRTWTARLDIDLPSYFDGDDKATYWYGAPGVVKSSEHITSNTTDVNGNFATFVADDEAVIISYTPGSDELP